ncbi:MAG: hypothetical protein RMZ69_10640 [Nostoc sp. ChiQUE01a]|nr:hypothetical protein [Nostoc sp. ChiQUE01a]
MKLNLFKGVSPIQKTKIRQQMPHLTIVRLKNLFRNPSIRVGSFLSVASILLIITPFLANQEINWFDIWQNLGYNLLGTVCAFVAFDVIFIRLKKIDEQQGVTLDYFNKSDFINRVAELKSFKRFSSKPMVTVRIMETWTELLRDSNYKVKFAQAIITCLENKNSEIEILLLNPENRDLVETRSAELKSISDAFDTINIVENLYINLREIQKIIQKLEVAGKQDRLKIKFYNNTPSLAMYMCAPHLFVTFFRSGKLTTMSEQLKLHIDSPVSAFINQRFEEIWQDAKTISLENCLYVTIDVIQSGKIQDTYDKVKYIFCDLGYYIQNSALLKNITNIQDINIRMSGKSFKPKVVDINDLPASVKKLFQSKYMNYCELFIYLELLI